MTFSLLLTFINWAVARSAGTNLPSRIWYVFPLLYLGGPLGLLLLMLETIVLVVPIVVAYGVSVVWLFQSSSGASTIAFVVLSLLWFAMGAAVVQLCMD